ncbi:MAG: TIGR00730 family Rossman fold protein [Pseudomonadota bacterium]|nr:TIGR00730 family Rossman fold protein [Pseudomonadota bacterium]
MFCGSREGGSESYGSLARDLGRSLACRGVGLVYGGGRAGLMGILANSVLEHNGDVLGVIPRFLYRPEVVHQGLTSLMVVENMHERKKLMYDSADAFAILPGGLGTLDEAVEIINWAHLSLHQKPICLLDVDGYWSLFCDFLSNTSREGFSDLEGKGLYSVAEDPGQMLDLWL